ncbi:MAG TPA: amino acid permease [Balneolaceae bacterium]|nr:amino acid permease [Balneolaceae bacterium]
MPKNKTTYARRLTLFDGIMVVVGGIIGAGIFLNPAIVAQRLPTSGLVLAAWAIGGGIALIGALCFGELGSRRPQAGGGYVYLREAFGPLPAFLYGWTQLFVINTGGISAVAMTFAYYAASLFNLGDGFAKPLAIGSVVLLTGINYLGIKPGSITQNIFTVLKLVAVAVLTVAGLMLFGSGTATETVSQHSFGHWDIIVAMGTALIPVLFAFGGWQHANNVAGEIRNPKKKLPQITIIGIIIVIVSYLLVNLAYVSALGVDGLASSSAPASDVTQALWGNFGGKLISAGIAISTFGFVNLAILGGARIYQAMADDGLFFKKAAKLHPKYRTPSFSLIIQAGWIIVLIFSGSYGQLLDYTVFGDWIFFGLIAATIFYYRNNDSKENSDESFRMPGHPVLPLLFILAAVFVVVSSIFSNLFNAMVGGGLILAGIPIYLYWKSQKESDYES